MATDDAASTFSRHAVAPANLFQSYAPLHGVYDEMLSAPGALRPHWQHVVHALDALGPQELARRWEHVRRLLYEHGVSYNVYGDPQGLDRPWEFDPLPLVIAESEWRSSKRPWCSVHSC